MYDGQAAQQPRHQLSMSGVNLGQQQQQMPTISASRSKCDQIIHEAITKACEIVVRSRCTARRDDESAGGASGRFNIEVDEVPSIRASRTMRAWTVATAAARRRDVDGSAVVPLRLDVYYEHDARFDHVAEAAATAPQRELLERWCFDYGVPAPNRPSSTSSPRISPRSSRVITTGIAPISSTSAAYSTSTSSNNGANGSSTAPSSSSSSSQLRLLCKRIVVLLRTVHCMTRMLPSNRLRNILLSPDDKNGGVDQGARMMLTSSHEPNITNDDDRGGSSNGRLGTIGYTVYIIDDHDDLLALPSPSFIYQSIPPTVLPTHGGGMLNMGVMYDVTLEPERMMNELSIIEYDMNNNSWKRMQQQQQQGQMQQQRGWQEGVSQLSPRGDGEEHQVQQQQEEEQWQINHYPQQQQQQQQQQYISSTNNNNPSLYSMPIPIVNQLVNTRQHVTSGGIGMNNNNNVNNTNNVNNDKQFRSSSLGSSNVRFGGGKIQRPRAVSDFIITDYQSTSPNIMIRPKNNSSINPGGTLPTIISQRAMSGLSLAMMNQEEVVFEGGINQHQQPQQNNVDIPPPPPPPPNDDDEWSSSVLPYGSSSTRRVAFHTPAPTADNDEQQLRVRSYSERGEGSMTSHFYHKHGGYGYGYNNGSNTAAANAPPSPIPRRPSDVYGTSGTLVRHTSTTPPLPTLLINRNSSGSIRSRSGSIGGTPPPPTSFLAGSRQHSAARTVSSSLADSSNSSKKNHHHRSSSSSSSSIAQLSSFLSPITSLDMLQTSPFSASHVHHKSTITTTSNNNEDGGSLLSSSHHPMMLGIHQHQDEMTVFLKSIPRMVPSSSSSTEERCCNTTTNNNNNNCTIASQTIQQTESEELQFAVDIPNPTSSTTTTTTTATKSPKRLRSLPKSSVDDTTTTSQSLLWGGTIEGTISGPSGDMANTLAASSLAHRCAADGKIRLKMFDDNNNNNIVTKDGGGAATAAATETSVTTTAGGDVIGGGVNGGNNNNNNAYHPAHRTHDPRLSSIEDQLSDFRSFGISLK